MVFIRQKKIKGRNYYYLVKSVRKKGRVQQLTLEYLGSKIPTKMEIRKFHKKYENLIKKKI